MKKILEYLRIIINSASQITLIFSVFAALVQLASSPQFTISHLLIIFVTSIGVYVVTYKKGDNENGK